jgi:GxxExxY protein
MPIHCQIGSDCPDAEEFKALDYRVMGHAYASQNELGRFCEEGPYQEDLKARLLADGLQQVLTEVPATVTHHDFSKQYFLDLVVDGALYELKAERSLVGEHEAQLLNYMFLLGYQRGKLLNFRPEKVEGRIAGTSLTQEERRRFSTNLENWKDVTPDCAILRGTMHDLLKDWGAFLDTGLYTEALIHFSGGVQNVEKRIKLHRNRLDLGAQTMLIYSEGMAFRISSHTEHQTKTAFHLRQLLGLTDLKLIQWINLNHNMIEFTTITR